MTLILKERGFFNDELGKGAGTRDVPVVQEKSEMTRGKLIHDCRRQLAAYLYSYMYNQLSMVYTTCNIRVYYLGILV